MISFIKNSIVIFFLVVSLLFIILISNPKENPLSIDISTNKEEIEIQSTSTTSSLSKNKELTSEPIQEEEKKQNNIKTVLEEDIETTISNQQLPIQENILKEEKITSTTSVSDINESTREAVINILCTNKSSGSFNPSTGSGVIIDARGVILTNAHIAQYFLLENKPSLGDLECQIRIGSPARAKYRAEVLYISSRWINDNSDNLSQQNPIGTGENDYAFLVITETINPTAQIPKIFPFIKIATNNDDLNTGDGVLVAAYPASFLGGISIQRDLYQSSTLVNIGEKYTFGEQEFDLFSLGGSVLAQKGSSGGAAVKLLDSLLYGIIVTSSEAEETGDRNLRAITVSHIERSLIFETGADIESLLSGNLYIKAFNFEEQAEQLANILIEEIK